MPDLTPIADITEPPYDGTADNGAKKRGRPAGSSTSAPRTRRSSAADKANIETALASMETLYSGATAALMLARRPMSAAMLAGQIEQLQASNRKAFEASPKLASTIATIGQFSAIGLFISSNVAVLGMVVVTARAEGVQNRADAENETQEPGNTPL